VIIPPPGTVSRIITSAKKKLWAKRHYFFYLPVYLSMRTRKAYPFFIDAYAQELEREVRGIAANHDWEILELTIAPDELTLALIASPDHSVERTVRNLKNFTLPLALKHPVHFRGKKIWASGFAASTDRRGFNQLREQHRQSLVGKDDQPKKGDSS
jgi:REP element-mobilizing transposase RayT